MHVLDSPAAAVRAMLSREWVVRRSTSSCPTTNEPIPGRSVRTAFAERWCVPTTCEVPGPMIPTLFAGAALLTAAVGFVWQARARAGRRKAVLDTYAEREIARLRRDKPEPSLRRRAARQRR